MRPTKDLQQAMLRLQRAALGQMLICPHGSYGGNVAADILAVLQALAATQQEKAS